MNTYFFNYVDPLRPGTLIYREIKATSLAAARRRFQQDDDLPGLDCITAEGEVPSTEEQAQ